MKENMALELYEKHKETLGLPSPFIFSDENDLFISHTLPIQSAVVFLPKSKALIDMTLALVSSMVKMKGKVVLVGTNDGGIRSARGAFEKNIGPVTKKIVGNHSALYVGINERVAGEKNIDDFLTFSALIYKDISVEVAQLPGVFSIGELDPGTKLFLDNIPYDKNKVLDVGCGSGVIGAIYKKKNKESRVTMTDSSLLAVKASKETVNKNKLSITVARSDVFSDVQDSFDLILSNPPFHSGIKTDYSFMEKFSKEAKAHMNKGGEVYVVANAFLPYKEILEKYIGPTSIIADDKKFRVYRSTKATSRP